MHKQDFIAMASPAAHVSSLASELPKGVTVAQAAVESEWGEKAPGHNYFGITGHGDLPDIPLETHECLTDAQLTAELQSGRVLKVIGTGTLIPGSVKKRYLVVRNFGAWSTMAANFAARDHMISTYPKYAPAYLAWINDHDIDAYVRAFAKFWASDSNYADTILSIYHENNLADLDKVPA